MAPSLELYSAKSDVINLTEANFAKFVLESDRLWIVQFYAPWCTYCRDYADEYAKTATALKGVVNVGAINSAFEQSLITRRFAIRGYPTVKLFGKDKEEPDDFNGERTAEALIEAALAMVRRHVYGALIDANKKKKR